MALTPSQAAAVSYEKHLILFAGPGSGKTSTSVAKGQRILAVETNKLCMVTFTSAAAEEMRERMAHKFQSQGLPPPGARLLCGTFHALALAHYKKHAKQSARLLGPPARTGMVNAMLYNVDPGDRKDYLLALEKYQGALEQSRVEFEKEEHRAFVMDYYKRLASTNSTDLSMIMRDCARLTSSGDMPLFPVTHLLGDEIQDADEIQLELILAHTRKGVITTLVGDDDQCIYEWRSALGYAGMLHFAKETGAKTIALAENFRSREEIVESATRLIQFNDPDRIEKNQKAIRGPGGRLGQRGFASLKNQCRFIASFIQLYRREGESVAVLARTNGPLNTLGTILYEHAIGYAKSGATIWDMPAVAILISTLNAMNNVSTGALHPVFSIFSISDKTRRELERTLGSSALNFLDGSVPPLSSATDDETKFLQKAATAFSVWRRQLSEGDINIVIPQVVDAVYDLYQSHLNGSASSDTSNRSQLKKIRQAFEDAESILVSLNGKLPKRLNTLSLLQGKKDDPDSIQLMTMHGSKGLEFDTVFLLDACEPDDGSLVTNLVAERRLFFVAITRAKENFYALYSDSPSPFIAEAGLPSIEVSFEPDAGPSASPAPLAS